MIEFNKWNDLVKHSRDKYRLRTFQWLRYLYSEKNNTAVLRSVDNTAFYKDNLENIDCVKYTPPGQENDQDINEPRFNAPHEKQIIYIYIV